MKSILRGIIHCINKYRSASLVVLGVLLFIGYFSFFTFNRYMVGYSHRLDLAHMDQTVWNSGHGHFFTLTDIATPNQISRFAIHADIMLGLLAPLYWIWADPRMLLLIQAVAVALGAIPIYLIAKKIGLNNVVAAVFSFSYLLYPPLQRSIIFDFHAVTLATPLILTAFYFILARRSWWFIFTCLLILTTKEQVALTTFMLGLFALVFGKLRYAGAAVMLVSLLWFYVVIWHIMPYFRAGQEHFALSYYGDYGNSPTSVIRGILTNPLKTIISFFTEGKLNYLLELFGPIGFLSLFSPFLLLAGPELGINLLSTNHQMWTIYFQYTAVITPLLFISALYATLYLSKLAKRLTFLRGQAQLALGIYLLSMTLVCTWFWGPLPGSRLQDWDSVTLPRLDYKVVEKAQAQIPLSAKVSVVDDLAPFFSRREFVYSFPTGIDRADYVIMSQEYMESVDTQHMLGKYKVGSELTPIFNEGKIIIFKNKP